MKLTEMKQLLAEKRIRLTKSLGQNFLYDANQLRRIVRIAELKKSDKVLEIGPGLGPLTEMLIEQSGEVLAIEKDARLFQVLGERFQTCPAGPAAPPVWVLHADALEYLRREPRDWADWKLVANLPYSVASPILVELALGLRGPQRMVATLQIEVAKRLMAKAGDPAYGVLSLLTQLDYEPRGSFRIPASCFFPEPDVDSACVCLVRRAQPPLPPELKRTFTRLVKQSFSQRRKMMLKVLKDVWSAESLANAFAKVPLSSSVRAECVSREQFLDLARYLESAG